eukprot:15033095-Alexandrium_andersonii.AAC.1
MVWGSGLRRTRRACEADMYISTSEYGEGHPALGHAAEMPWVHMYLSRFQDIGKEERRAVTITDT